MTHYVVNIHYKNMLTLSSLKVYDTKEEMKEGIIKNIPVENPRGHCFHNGESCSTNAYVLEDNIKLKRLYVYLLSETPVDIEITERRRRK